MPSAYCRSRICGSSSRTPCTGRSQRQHLAVEDQTEHYVVNLLTLFARSEALYESTPEGRAPASRSWSCCARRSRRRRHRRAQPRPAAPRRRVAVRRRILCAQLRRQAHRHRLPHRHGRARLRRAAAATARGSGRVLAAVFAELSEKFQPMVDALNEVSESSYTPHRPRHPAPLRDLAEDRQRALLCPPRSASASSRPRAGGTRLRALSAACCCRVCRSLIGGIYDVSVAHDVYDFLVTDRGHLPPGARGGAADEELIVGAVRRRTARSRCRCTSIRSCSRGWRSADPLVRLDAANVATAGRRSRA